MTKPIVIEYETSAKAVAEAMGASFAWIMGPWRWLHMISGIIAVLLVSFGGGALVITIGLLATGAPEAGLPYVWIGSLAAGALFLLAQNWPLRLVARHSAQSPYGRGTQTATFDQDGMTIQNGQSRWQTNWAAIENVKLGKRGMIVHVAGLAFAIPMTDQANPTEIITQIERWKQAG